MKLEENSIPEIRKTPAREGTARDKENTSKVDLMLIYSLRLARHGGGTNQIQSNHIFHQKLFCLIFQQRNSIYRSFSIVNCFIVR